MGGESGGCELEMLKVVGSFVEFVGISTVPMKKITLKNAAKSMTKRGE